MAKLGHMPNEPTPLSVNQAAEALGTSRRSIIRRIHTREIAATKLGDGTTSAWAIPAAEIDRLLTETKAAS